MLWWSKLWLTINLFPFSAGQSLFQVYIKLFLCKCSTLHVFLLNFILLIPDHLFSLTGSLQITVLSFKGLATTHNLALFLKFASSLAIPSARSLMEILNRNRLRTCSHETLLNMPYQCVSKLLLTTFWLFFFFFLSDQGKMCSIFLKFCFSSLLLTGPCGTRVKPYLESMWIISTLPTWPNYAVKMENKWFVIYYLFQANTY